MNAVHVEPKVAGRPDGATSAGARRSSAAQTRIAAAAALVSLVWLPATLRADFFEGFNTVSQPGWEESGPSNLIADGWIFRNQDQPTTVSPAWTRGFWFPPQEGARFLFSGLMNLYDVNPVSCSRWAILPNLPEVAPGGTVTIWAIGYNLPQNNHSIEVRLSTSGGTSTGSGVTAVGDFNTLLGSINPTGTWLPHEFTLPSGGRVALRYVGMNMQTNGGNGAYVGIDALTVGPPAIDPACNPPLPAPGETIVWSVADGPYKICVDTTIPEGATLVLEPGVTIEFQDFAVLRVEGRLTGAGTAAQPVALTTPTQTSHTRLQAVGTVDLQHAQIGIKTATVGKGVIRVSDGVFLPTGGFSALQSRTGLIQLQNCVAQSALHPFTLGQPGNFEMRNVTIAEGDLELAGFAILDGVTLQNGQLLLVRDFQRASVGNVTISNPAGPALKLRSGSDFYIGPDVTILAHGGEYPIHLQGGGLTPDSQVIGPAILGPQEGEPGGNNGHFTWPNLGVPYVLPSSPYFSVNATIEPGVTIRMGEWSGVLLFGDVLSTVGRIKGLPEAPIRFESLSPATHHKWFVGAAGGINLLEHVIIDGAGLGVTAPQSDIDVRECIVQNCETGMQPTGFGYITVHGTRIFNNGTGVIDDPASIANGMNVSGAQRPNMFVGNTIAVDHVLGANGEIADIQADNNWWGHPTGPFNEIFNPVGQGDPVSIAALFEPFLSSEPDLSDIPPVVRMERPFVMAEPGTWVLLQWEASDDHDIVHQTIWLEADGGGAFNPQPIEYLPGDVRSHLWQVPFTGPTAEARKPVLRIEATDTAGNTGYDQVTIQIPAEPHVEGNFAFTTDLSGPFTIGQEFDLCWQAVPVAYSNITVFVVLDGDENIYREGEDYGSCMSGGPIRLPLVSTDTARIGLRVESGGNRVQWYFSDNFAIRPHAAIGDAPPQVNLLSPNGLVPVDGSAVPIQWSAADDDGLRDFRVQASLDGGRTWTTIARDLPGDATSLLWQQPAGDGSVQAIVRVVAFDTTFQNSSSDSMSPLPLPGDLNGDGVVGFDDADLFVAVLLGLDSDPGDMARADLNQDGTADGLDVQPFADVLIGN